MKTLTVTKARQNLGVWLKRAVSGEEIGVIVGDQVVAFRPVPIMAADYAESEYGLTREEVDAAAARIVTEVCEAAAPADFTEYKPGILTNENSSLKAVPRARKKVKRA